MVRRRRHGPINGLALAFALLVSAWGFGTAAAQVGDAPRSEVFTLEEAVTQALQHAPDVVNARRSLERGALTLESAEQAFKPKASASASAAATEGGSGVRAAVSGSGTITPGTTWSVNLSSGRQSGSVGLQGFGNQPLSTTLSVNVRLWPPGQDADSWRALESRQSDLGMAEQRLTQAERSAVIAVADAYGRLVVARGRLALGLEALETSRLDLERQRERRAQGMASESDVIKAEIALLEQEGAVSSRRQTVDSLTATLAGLVGAKVDTVAKAQLVDALDLGTGWTPPDQEVATQRAKAASLSIASQTRALEAAKQSLDILRRAGGASVSLGGALNADQGDAIGWSVRVDGSYDLFDGGAQANRLATAERDVEDAEMALERAIEEVEDSVTAAYRELANGERTVAIARATVELRVRELEIGKEQAARGLISDEALRRLERDVQSARFDLESEELVYKIALMKLKALLGIAPF